MAPSSKQMSQKEYLKKYLSKKKKKKPRRGGSRRENVKLIDDDAVNRIDDNPFDDFEDGEDAPMIAGYYDERPTEVKLLENYRNANRWQPMPGAEKESDGGNQKSRIARDGHQSPIANRRERFEEDSRNRKRKHRSGHLSSPPRSKHRQELSSPARRTPPRNERRMEERGGYSPSRRGDQSKFEEQRLYSDVGQRFRDNDHSPRRANSGRYNGGGDGDRYRPEEQIYDERFGRSRQRQRSVDSGSPNYRNQRMDDEFRGLTRRSDPHLSPFGERDRFERPASPATRRKERPDDRRYVDEGRREFAAGDHRMTSSRNQRNRRHSDAESPLPSKHQPSSRGDDRSSSKMGVSYRHNTSPVRNERRLSPDRRISPAKNDWRMSPSRNERRVSPSRNERRVSPPRNERRVSPPRNNRRLSSSPRANLDDSSWRRSFSPAPSRRYHSPVSASDSRRGERRDDISPARIARSRNERPSPSFRGREDGRRIEEDPLPPLHRKKDRSREEKHARDRRREMKDLQDIRDVSIDPFIVQEASAARDPRGTRDPRHGRETFRDAGEHRRDRAEAKEPIRIIEWKEKSTAVSRSVPAKRVADPSPPPRAESPRRREASPPSRKHKEKSAVAGPRKGVADEHRRTGGRHELPPSKHRAARQESQADPPFTSPKHRASRHEPRPSTPPSRHPDESKQRTHKRDPVERDPRGRRTSPALAEGASSAVKNADRPEKRSDENAPSKGAKKRDREDREHKKSEKSSRPKDEKFGLLSTKKSSSKPEDKLSDEQAGKNAATIYRDAKTGKKRDLQEEKLEKIEKRRREDKKMEQYYKWGRGLKQVAEEDERIKEEQYEMSKPLARYADDDDLDKTLKQKEISGLDPMLEYIHRKKRKKEAKEGKVTRPQYKGSWPPNRFNIPPGHKWDGVDRSNGYENRYFAKQSDKKAMEEEAYKWCSEDM